MLKKKNIQIILVLLGFIVLGIPFLVIPDYAVLISASTTLILSLVFVFYQVALIMFEKNDNAIATLAPIGLPGEKQQQQETIVVKKKKIPVNPKLPGVMGNSSLVEPEFEIDDTEIKRAKMFGEISEVELTRGFVEIITFWDSMSFYKIMDSEIYTPETVKVIGELYEYIFSGLGAYLQRYKLTIDDLLNEETIVKEYGETFSSVVVGFVVSLVEREVANSLNKTIDRTEIVIPKTKTKNPGVSKVIISPEFKYQILLLVQKYYEKQN